MPALFSRTLIFSLSIQFTLFHQARLVLRYIATKPHKTFKNAFPPILCIHLSSNNEDDNISAIKGNDGSDDVVELINASEDNGDGHGLVIAAEEEEDDETSSESSSSSFSAIATEQQIDEVAPEQSIEKWGNEISDKGTISGGGGGGGGDAAAAAAAAATAAPASSGGGNAAPAVRNTKEGTFSMLIKFSLQLILISCSYDSY